MRRRRQVEYKSAKTKRRVDVSHTEIDRCCSRIIRIHGEAHAQQLNVSFDEQGAVNVDLACASVLVQTYRRTVAPPWVRCSEPCRILFLDRLVIAGEVHLERASRSCEASLSLTEGSKFFAASFRD